MLLIAVVWTGILSFSLWNYIKNENESVILLAQNVIQNNYFDIDTFRHWIATQGGVYVPISDKVKPNALLSDLPDRDVTTPTGKQLTLLNTPYILKQLAQDKGSSSLNAHMTSLNPLNPLNAADEWETKAFKLLKDGRDQFCEIVDYKNEPHMRLIKPSRFVESCGNCHTDNGYKNGDLLGGLTVSIPMQPYYDKAAKTINKTSINHGIIWFLGLSGLGILYRNEKKHDLKRKSMEETLQHLAQHDHLTKLPNRVLLNDRLEHAMNRAERENKKLAVLFLDLDNFKNINDSMGHEVGDNILIQISNRLKDSIRKGDTLARYGGDEFIVVMEEVDNETDAINLAEKLINCVNPDFILEDKHYKLGLSIGISIYPEHSNTVSALISSADKAMYSAKIEGRNTYKVYSQDMH